MAETARTAAQKPGYASTDIAIVGLGCRLPGAPTLQAFWDMLRAGDCARVEFDDDRLRAAGVSEQRLRDPAYVKAGMVLDDIDQFDAGFFGFSPRDASIMDPQHRVFLEVSWEAFEHSGHVPDKFDGRVGVFAGCGMDTYLLYNVLSNPQLVRDVGMFLIRHTGNDKDFLATRVSYQFDLRGPSINVLTACSTSLVAVHQAAQSLLANECDMALAGGVTILVPQDRGYRYEPGEILSPDGHCRAFDADSKGTIFGSGAGVVVLRRLDDALRDGDTIHGVIAGSAINNDGARKVGYLAPSVDGYAEVVAEALALADVPADQVQYVEAHGTGTPVGDPIEIEALSQAFRVTTDQQGFCGIGSVKTNIGHLDTAAGVAGLLKVLLGMKHGRVPPSLNFQRPNPLIDFERSPFRVVAAGEDWPQPDGGLRIAGVSSLGVGGTNAHVVVKQAPRPVLAEPTWPRRYHLLPVSARTQVAVDEMGQRLSVHLEEATDDDVPRIAWTLQEGRKAFAHRAFAVGLDAGELAAELGAGLGTRTQEAPDRARPVVFLFPGGGAQYPGMGRGLYEHEPAYRTAADECLRALPAGAALELRELLFGQRSLPAHGQELERPSLALPALFLTEYALARTLWSFGVEPDAMLGHSMGEYTAACLAGVFSAKDGMTIVRLRGTLFEEVQKGAMLSVALSSEQLGAHAAGEPGTDADGESADGDIDGNTGVNTGVTTGGDLVAAELSLAAANAPELSAVAGTVDAIERFEARLQQRGVDCQRLRIDVAAHSHLLDPILERFRQGLAAVQLRPAERPFLSNVTGDWIEPERAADADYWVQHLRQTVRFQDGVATLLASGDRTFVEVGPGRALTSLVRMHPASARCAVTTSLPHAQEQENVPADRALLECLGRLFQAGVAIDWRALHGGPRRRVPLPTYAFQRQRYWIEPGRGPAEVETVATGLPARLPPEQWLRRVRWVPRPSQQKPMPGLRWLCIGRGGALAAAVAERVQLLGGTVFHAVAGREFEPTEHGCTFAPRDADSIARMLTAAGSDGPIQRVLFLLAADGAEPVAVTTTLVRLYQALGQTGLDASVRLLAVTTDAVAAGAPPQQPGQAVVHGLLRVVPVEYPGGTARALDVEAAALRPQDPRHADLADLVLCETESEDKEQASAWRGGERLQATYPALLADGEGSENGHPAGVGPLRERGVYLITGGLGGLGMVLAEYLARRCSARLVLVTRRGLPPAEIWDDWLQHRATDRTGRAIASVRRLQELGAEVLVCAADVADPTAVADVIARTRARFSALHGVFHTAGVLDDGPMQLRTPLQVEQMLRPKVHGAQVLDAATAQQPPELMVLFASTSGLFGIPGQCDYAAANAFLDAFAAWRSSQRPGRTLAVDWGVWRQVGMVAEATAALRLQPGTAVPELLGECRERDDGLEYAATWSPVTHWPLSEHRLHDGRCVLPGTGHLELCLMAARAASGRSDAVQLDDVELRAPLMFGPDETRRVYVVVRPDAGGLDLRVESASADGRARTEHARAFARAGGDAGPFVHLDAWWQEARRAPSATTSQHRFVQFGPRWNCAVERGYGDDRVTARLRLPNEFTGDLERHPLHAAVVDAAILAAVPLLPGADRDTLYAPVACRRLQWSGALPGEVAVRAHVLDVEAHSGIATVDVEFATLSGVPIARLDGLQLLGLQGGFAAAPAAAGARAADRPKRRPPVLPQPVQDLLAAGIAPDEGMHLLARAIDSGAAQVVASPLDPAAVAAFLARPQPTARPQQFATKPAKTGAVTDDAPRDEIERFLAAAFRDLLGLDHVGLDQDFFDLGGHSLLAVRLFARIHQEHGLDLELATLLGSGSVRGLASVLRQHLGASEPAARATASAGDGVGDDAGDIDGAGGREPAPPVFRGEHLVPIQPRGDRPILFLVHGAGGNVLGFRDLAHYLGADQPVYGLQARGVDGKRPPHETLEDMARDYVRELQLAQPHGPYYLGGYSGGGCVAYEMARQLRQQGEAVAFVGMIDTPTPHMKERNLVVRGAIHVRRLWERGPLYPVRMLRMKLDQRRTRSKHQQIAERGEVMPQELRGAQMQDAFEQAFFRYEVKPYDGKVWLFRAETETATRFVRDRTLGWGPFPLRGVATVDCPGDHFSMCAEPHIQVLCRQLREAMDGAIESVGAPVPAG